MKAKITTGERYLLLALEPETEEERQAIGNMGSDLSRPHLISHRGFGYMRESVEFYVQPMPRGD
jgi:hypothetical protein